MKKIQIVGKGRMSEELYCHAFAAVKELGLDFEYEIEMVTEQAEIDKVFGSNITASLVIDGRPKCFVINENPSINHIKTYLV